METCGPYTIVNEIGSSDGSTSYLARGPEGEVALNVFTDADTESAGKRIELQEGAAALSPHVARVLQHGSCEDGEWYSTPVHRRSIEKLLEGRVALSKLWILEILRAITAGALAFKKSAGRAHGNLQPYNILLSSSETIKEAEIVIKDPSLDGTDTEARDLKAIGLTLYQLVRRREVEQESIILPLELSAEWKSVFGKEADEWLGLCNRLLDSNLSTESYNLEQLDRDLEALLPKPPVSRKQLVAVGVVLACAALVAALFYWRSLYAKIEIATNLPGAAATLSSQGKVLKTVALRDKPVAIKLRKGRYELRAVYTNGVYQGVLTASTSVDLQGPESVTLTFGFGTLHIDGVSVTANGVTNIVSSADLKVEPGKQIKYPIVSSGYRPDAVEETVAAGETRRIVRRLEKLAANEVRIDIQTTPRELKVEIRGTSGVKTEASPVTTALAAGRYTVSVQFRGEMKTTNVELTAEKSFTDANALHVDFETTELTIIARNDKGTINDPIISWENGTSLELLTNNPTLWPIGKEFTFVTRAHGHDPATNRFLLDRPSMTRTQVLNTILGIVDVRSDPPTGVLFGTNAAQREWPPKKLDLVPGDYTFYATHEDLGTVTWRGTILRGTTNITLQYAYGGVKLFANLPPDLTNVVVSHSLNPKFRPMHLISLLPPGTNHITAIYARAGLTNVSDVVVQQGAPGNPRPHQIKFDYATVIFTTNSVPGISVDYDRDGQTIPVGEIRQGETLPDIVPLGIARTYRFRTGSAPPKTNLHVVKIDSPGTNFVTAELQRKFVIPELDMEFLWVDKLPGYVGKTEVTQAQYQKVIGNHRSVHRGSTNPVDSVMWTEAQKFCNDLPRHKPPETGFKYALPTQAQWTKFVGDALSNAALAVVTGSTSVPVASKPPNQFGLYDVRGNVSELTDEKTVVMGHSFKAGLLPRRTSTSISGDPTDPNRFDTFQADDVGFRVILIPVAGLAKNP